MESLVIVGIGLLLVLAITWLILPFIVMGTNSRLDTIKNQIDPLRATNEKILNVQMKILACLEKIAEDTKRDTAVNTVSGQDLSTAQQSFVPKPLSDIEKLLQLTRKPFTELSNKTVEYWVRKGWHSTQDIASGLNIPKEQVEQEGLQLYREGQLTRSEIEKALRRDLTKDEII